MLPGITAIRRPVLESDIKINVRAIIDKNRTITFPKDLYLVKLNKL